MIKHCPLWIPYVLYLLFRFAYFLLEVPTVRMVEYAACHQQLDRVGLGAALMLPNLDETACKTPAVQEQVARIIGWKMSFDAIPGFLMAMYFGRIADERGHCFVLTLCCLGYLLATLWMLVTCYFHETFPISFTWFSSLFLFIGGGPFVFAAVTAALVAGLVEELRRTRYLFLLAAIPHLGKLVSPLLAKLLMAENLYAPSVVSSILIMLCILLLGKVKKSEYASKTTSDETDQSSESLLGETNQLHTTRTVPSADDHVVSRGDMLVHHSGPTSGGNITVTEPLTSRTRLRKIVAHLRREPVLGFCYFAFYMKSVAMASEAFVFQYLSEKFGWRLQDTAILRFALSFGAVLATMVIGPLVSSRLARRGVPTLAIDLGIIYVSLFILTICFSIAWQTDSSTVFILSMLGAGFCEGLDPALQGLLSIIVSTKETGSLFAFVYMCGLLGDITGGPLMSMLMSIGRSEKSASNGYCFLASSLLFGILGVLAFIIRGALNKD